MISLVSASGEEIYEIIQGIESVIEGYSRAHCIIAMLALVITCQKPDATPEEIQEGVKGVSEWICTYLDSEGDGIKH